MVEDEVLPWGATGWVNNGPLEIALWYSQWIVLGENLQENPTLNGKNHGFRLKSSIVKWICIVFNIIGYNEISNFNRNYGDISDICYVISPIKKTQNSPSCVHPIPSRRPPCLRGTPGASPLWPTAPCGPVSGATHGRCARSSPWDAAGDDPVAG